tara:strand:- start:435 stop:728 length:294 start_codon:yes stop_codon:yes gene_type:complete
MKKLMTLAFISTALFAVNGCVVTEAVKERVGDRVMSVMEDGRMEFCSGTFPLASYERHLKSHNKSWKDYDEWCNRQYGISSEDEVNDEEADDTDNAE